MSFKKEKLSNIIIFQICNKASDILNDKKKSNDYYLIYQSPFSHVSCTREHRNGLHMTVKNIILLLGSAQSGKDTRSQMLRISIFNSIITIYFSRIFSFKNWFHLIENTETLQLSKAHQNRGCTHVYLVKC